MSLLWWTRFPSNPVNFCLYLTVLFRATHEQWCCCLAQIEHIKLTWCSSMHHFHLNLDFIFPIKRHVYFLLQMMWHSSIYWGWCFGNLQMTRGNVWLMFFSSVCCSSVSNWSVLVLRKRGGREGAFLLPHNTRWCTSMEPHNTRCGTLWSPVKYHSVPHQYYLWPCTSCLWRWAPISTVAPKLLPMTHKFCHFNTPREHFYVNSQTSHKTQELFSQ